VPVSQFDKDSSKIKKTLDRHAEARVDGMTKQEMEEKESQEEDNIHQLSAKEKELKEANGNIRGAEEAIEKEKAKIDREIKEKMSEEDEIQKYYASRREEREMKRKTFEMKLQEEELADKKEEKAKKEKQLEETKKIEKDAIALNEKEAELKKNETMVEGAIKEVSGEAAKVKKDAEELKLNEVKVDRLEKELEAKLLMQEKKEKREKELMAKKKMEEAEAERREKLKKSCPQSKVRTYVCKEDGTRLIKYFDYQYDFEESQCVENVKSKTEKCKEHVIIAKKQVKKVNSK